MLSTVVLPQPEWPMMQTNSPRAIDSHRSSNTIVLPPLGAAKRLVIPSMEMNLSAIGSVRSSVMRSPDPRIHPERQCPSPRPSLRKRHQPRDAGENLIEQHPDDPDHQDRGDHVGDREIVPFVPDEIADAGAADEHLGGHDHQPRN